MDKYITGSKVGILLLCALLMSACSTNSTTAQSEALADTTAASGTTVTQDGAATGVQLASAKLTDLVTFDEDDSNTSWTADQSTDIALAGTSAVIDGTGAESKDGSVTITAAGTYVLSGKLNDGQIVINNQDDGIVHLVLNGVNISDSDNAAIYIKEAGKVIITLEDGTENSVSDGVTYVYADEATDEPSAAIFSKADLTINGTGKLSVSANYNDGITSKDDLKIMNGTLEIKAADDGMVGKDLVAVQDGKLSITAEGDGIKSTNDTEADKGFIAIAAGTFDIKAGNDGIQAETALVIDDGTYTVVTGGGNVNGEVKTGDQGAGMGMRGDRGQGTGGKTPGTSETSTPETKPEMPAQEASTTKMTTTTTTTTTESETASTKGLKAGGDISINNGMFTIDSADDAVHSNSNIAITDGELHIQTGDDGIHADALVAISGGKIDITKSYEGIEGANIAISGGEANVVSSDDGVNVAGGNDEATAGGGPQEQDQFSEAAANVLTISGGMLTVDAAGDGLDSNGSIVMSGGTVIVNGPTNGGNGSLDFDGSFEQSGGTLIAAGSSGMAQAPSDTSSQHAISMTFPQTQKAGTLVHLEDSEGNTILTFAPSKDYQSVVISSPELKDGGSYTLYSGGTSTGSEVNGLYTDGDYTGGTQIVAFEITSNITWLNESGVTTANTNQGPGGGGRRNP